MTDFFLYNNQTGSLELNTHEILLVKEFEALWDKERNKCSEDPTGNKRLRAWKEFKYIWLFADWKSPYQQYLEMEKHKAALEDSGLTDEEWNDQIFRAAVRKYIEIKDSSRILGVLKAGFRALEKLRVFLDNIDLDERDPLTNKPIWKGKDILDNLGSIGVMMDRLRDLEEMYKKDLLDNKKSIKGDREVSYDD